MAGEIKSLKMKGSNEALFDFKVRDLGGVAMDDLEKELDLRRAAQSSKASYCMVFAIGSSIVHAFGQGGYRS